MTELDSAISEYDSLMAEKNRLAVLAPFDGEIIELNDILTIGEWIAKDESLLSIGQFSNYQIEADVYTPNNAYVGDGPPPTNPVAPVYGDYDSGISFRIGT